MQVNIPSMIRCQMSALPKSRILSLWVILFFFPLFVFSQTEVVQEDSTAVQPRAVGSTEIARYGQDTRELITNIARLQRNAARLQAIRDQLVIGDSIVQAKEEELSDTLQAFRIDQLDIIESQIRNAEVEVLAFQEEVANWRTVTDGYKQDVGFYLDTWGLTLDSLSTVEKNTDWQLDSDTTKYALFSRIKDEITSNYNNTAEVEAELSVWDQDLMRTENALALALNGVNTAFSMVSEKRRSLIDNIWTPEYPPIWKFKYEGSRKVTGKQIADQLRQNAQSTLRYLKTNQRFSYGTLFWFITIFVLIIYLKNRNSEVKARLGELDEHERIVLKYPIIVSYIIVLFGILIQEEEITRLGNVILLTSIIPFSVLIWELNEDKKMQRVAFFVLFSLLLVFISIMVLLPNLLRIGLLVINGLVLYLLVVFRRDSDIANTRTKYWFGTLRTLTVVFIFFNILSVIANVLGSVQLALILTRATLGTIIAFVILRECVLVAQAFIHLVLLGPIFKKSYIIRDDSVIVIQKLNKLLRVLGYIIWIYITLDLLQLRESILNGIVEYVNKPLQLGELSISLGNVLAFYIIIQISLWLSRLVRYVFEKEIFPRTKISSGAASTFSLLTKYTITFIGFLFALAGAGIELSKVVLGFSALGIGIGFGLQNIINNFISGIILAVERPFKIGDAVLVDDVEGIVVNIGLRASQIKTWNGSNVLVPNGDLISGKLTNWTYEDNSPRRLDIAIHLPVDTNVPEVMDLILSTAKKVKGVMKNPGVVMNHEGIHEGELVLRLYAWIASIYEGFAVGTALKTAVFKTLMDNGYEAPMPKLDVSLRNRNLSRDQHKDEE